MKVLMIYLKTQTIPLIMFALFIITPFIMVSQYLPQIPYTLYFFLIILFLIKLLVHNDSAFEKRVKPKVQSQLAKELKRNPSSKEIYQRMAFNLKARDFTLLLTGVLVITLGILFGKL